MVSDRMDEILASIFRNQWLVLIIVGLLLLALAEIGFRAGLRLFVRKDEPRKGQIGGIQGAVLGLLALLLGFTFSMAVTRYEIRRDLVLKEANAIGTTYLRASLLPEEQAKTVEDLLSRYIDARLTFFSAGNDSIKLAAAEDETTKLQRELWTQTAAAVKEAPTPITATFINALNDTIDLDATRLHALRSRVPSAVWLLLLVVAGAVATRAATAPAPAGSGPAFPARCCHCSSRWLSPSSPISTVRITV